MKVQDLTLTDELRDIVQIGIITDDIERTKKGMLEVFGLEPDAGGHSVYKKSVYRDGKVVDAEVVSAFYNFFNIQLEFLQPTGEDDTIWSDYLKMGQNGLHHIRFDVTDNDVVTKLMAEKGIAVWVEGTSLIDPTARFTYYDSLDKLGFIVEAVTRSKN